MIRRGSRKERVGLHREAEAHLVVEYIGDLIQPAPELLDVEDESRRAILLRDGEKFAVIHIRSFVYGTRGQ